MNFEKMSEVIRLFNELAEENSVIGFTFHENGFHVRSESLINTPDLQIESRGDGTYPYAIFVQYDGFKVFAIIKHEQLKDFPQFKEQAKAALLEQLAELEKEEEATA